VPPFGPVKRRDLIHYLEQFGFEGPYAGGRHEYMIKGELKLALPNPHQSDIGRGLLARILRQAGIERDEWERI
jgi:predicted RNA binding protein YcfA (HicA-like mRNA interferase family)